MNNDTPLGTYIYMGMGKCKGHTVCISVAYKLDYAVKKAMQFEELTFKDIEFYKVNKVRVGELEAEISYSREELANYIHEYHNPKKEDE